MLDGHWVICWQRLAGRSVAPHTEKLADEIAAGWQVYPFSDSQPLADVKSALDGVDALVSTITAIGGSDPVLDAHGETLRNFTGWTGYVSATSIYPDKPQGFCYEDTPPEPATARGRARLAAEHRWLDLLGAEIFRAAGIYGPGQVPLTGCVMARRGSSSARGRFSTESMLRISAGSSPPQWHSPDGAGSSILPMKSRRRRAM